MPSTLTYPGVYIEEVSSGVHTITGVATSIAAFVGYTSRGLDNYATQVFSFADFERAFGGLAANSELSYAVQQFFLNGGTTAWVVRVPANNATAATVKLLSGTGGGAAVALTATLRSSGTWSDQVIIDVDYDGVADQKSFNLTITDLASNTSESFSNVSMDSNQSNFVENVVNDPDSGSALVSVKANGATSPVQSGTVGGPADVTKFNDSTKTYTIKVSCDLPAPSPPINGVEVTVLGTGEAAPTSVSGACHLLETKLTQLFAQKIPGASVRCEPNKDQNGKWGIRASALIPGALDGALSFDDAGLTAGNVSADSALNLKGGTANVSHYWAASDRGKDAFAQQGAAVGSDGDGLPHSDKLIGDPGSFTGIYALEKVDLFNILCIPEATRAQASDPSKQDSNVDPNAIFTAALAYCKQRRAFLLIDVPPTVNSVAKAVDWKTSGLTVHDAQGSAAAYFPRLKLPDPLNNFQLRTFAPCGVMAGLYSRIDAARGVWKAPAGVEASLTGVQAMVYQLTDQENGALNPLGLNCSRVFPVYGPVAWGARTIAGADAAASEWKYVPVRRFALFLEESLYRGTKWVVFEPNDEPLWAQIRLNIGAFMQGLFRQGAFQGKTPQEAYFVKCDKDTTTQNDIDLGIVNI
ncbi:MAG TPA: phage tail sheath C-terminal domain-containing protein, partial [Patescibacteria group bacterium]|nr:phage tail sheath C-terminal domain-containing protein [Patescibacteria group bacterium]